jgi:hypothetical protein
MRFHVPWSNEDLYNLVSLRETSSPKTVLSKSLHRGMRLKLHRPPPLDEPTEEPLYPSLELFLDPQSSYILYIDASPLDMLSQLIRYYVFLLPTFLFTVLCISFSLQVNEPRLRIYQTMLAWQFHLPIACLIAVIYRISILCFPRSHFVVNLYDNGYYFFFLPLILYAVALSIWALIALIVDNLIFELFRPIAHPLIHYIHHELTSRVKYSRWIQSILLMLPLLATMMFGGSNGHITLFFLAVLHTIWRGTINQRLREILNTLLFFHGLLVVLNLSGFIVHVRSVLIQGLLPLYVIMSDPSFVSAICSISAFYCRFLLDRFRARSFWRIQLFLYRYSQMVLIILALVSQVYCSYMMDRLWIFICFVFIHAAILFFIPLHRE